MKIRDIIRKKTNEILKSKIKLIGVCSLFIVLIVFLILVFKFTYAIPENSNYDLFFPPKVREQTKPRDLLVMVFLYDDYDNHNEDTDYVFNMTDEEVETKYYNEIFGSGSIEEQTWSVNDFFKENSKGKFYFNPILINDNNTGIYLIRFNKKYDMNDFSSDMRAGFESLVEKGLNTDGFNSIYGDVSEKSVLCIFPKIKVANQGGSLLADKIYAETAVVSYTNGLSVTTHELAHSIELPDLYGQDFQPTLMGYSMAQGSKPDGRYPFLTEIIPNHIDPIHKISLGWVDYELINENQTIKLYPTTSNLYKPVIIPTNDNNQYFIIENRKANSFETQISNCNLNSNTSECISNEGLNIWRIEKVGYDNLGAYNDYKRKGDYIIDVLNYENDYIYPEKYISSNDKNCDTTENTNIKITYIKKNEDDSIDVNVNFDEKYKNSYIVRYNANDGTENYIDKTYFYTENIENPGELFIRPDYKFLGWNTKSDESGQWYIGDFLGYGLTDEKDGIVNLYAQWKKEKYTISFNANGGIGTMEAVELTENMINDGYILPEPQFTSPSENLKFKGWYVSEYESVKQPGETVYLSGDNELVAQWGENLPNNCIIVFNTNGGTNIDNQQITKGGLVVEPQIPVKEGYVFGGWYEDDTYNIKFYFGKPIYSDMTLYAKWISNENIIKSINIKMEIPTVGDKVTIEKEKFEDMEFWDWNSQKPQMKITISDEEHYHLADDGGAYNYMHWITKDSFETILDPYDIEPFVGSFEYNTDYYARIFLETNNGYLFDSDITVTVNGSNNTKIINIFEEYMEVGVVLATPKEIGKYTILEGINQKYLLNSDKDLIIKADGDISDFEDIKVDDVTVDKENYTITSGSTIVTLKQSYLNTLLEGTHKISFVYKDGEVSTTFTINNSKNNDTSDDVIIQENSTTTKPSAIDDNEESNSSPATGDNIILWIIISIIAVVGTIVTYKNIKKNNSKY